MSAIKAVVFCKWCTSYSNSNSLARTNFPEGEAKMVRSLGELLWKYEVWTFLSIYCCTENASHAIYVCEWTSSFVRYCHCCCHWPWLHCCLLEGLLLLPLLGGLPWLLLPLQKGWWIAFVVRTYLIIPVTYLDVLFCIVLQLLLQS